MVNGKVLSRIYETISPTLSMNAQSPYLFYEFWVPKRQPYYDCRVNKDRLATSSAWPSICGDFIIPLLDRIDKSFGMKPLCWFVQEGPFFQICFSCPSFALIQWSKGGILIERLVREQCKISKFRTKRLLRGNLGGALAGDRWNNSFGTKKESNRSILMVDMMDKVCRLYLTTLIRRKNKTWMTEKNKSRQNPHGNIFESVIHLLANISEAKFDVFVQAKTGWMHEGYQQSKVKCHL